MAEHKKLGLIINPIAGIGGRVGLKGSDGSEIQRRALELGAVPRAQDRAAQALERLGLLENLGIVTYPGEMGESVARGCGFEPTVIGSIREGETTAEDTRQAARDMLRLAVDLLLFAGGDGTARDVYEAVGLDLAVLGIPAGVKIHSAVYATNPRSAGGLAALYLQGRVEGLREAEVLDIDEEAVRRGVVSAKLYGYLKVPYRSSLVQNLKVPSSGEAASLASIAHDVVDKMQEDWLYIVGPGTTTRAITDELELPKTLIGVDVVRVKPKGGRGETAGELVAADVNETQLMGLLDSHGQHRAAIIVTPIGGQGCIFGRGNQQISPRVIDKVGRENVVVVSAKEKLYALGSQPLWVDTGDPAVDEMLSGYIQVVTGYNERAVRRISR
jgi:predicted polyphosphate/ATP-dependent NAD kinase